MERGDGKTYAYNMWGGVQQLWTEGAAPLAICVLLWSGIFPYCKLGVISYLDCCTQSRQKPLSNSIRLLSVIAKWSFLDVWIVAITVLCVRIEIYKEQTLLNLGKVRNNSFIMVAELTLCIVRFTKVSTRKTFM